MCNSQLPYDEYGVNDLSEEELHEYNLWWSEQERLAASYEEEVFWIQLQENAIKNGWL